MISVPVVRLPAKNEVSGAIEWTLVLNGDAPMSDVKQVWARQTLWSGGAAIRDSVHGPTIGFEASILRSIVLGILEVRLIVISVVRYKLGERCGFSGSCNLALLIVLSALQLLFSPSKWRGGAVTCTRR